MSPNIIIVIQTKRKKVTIFSNEKLVQSMLLQEGIEH